MAAPLPPFQRLIDDHAQAVAAFLGGMVPRAEVDDALQETLIAALRAYPRFDGANPRAWLMTIARHKAIDMRRSAKRRPEHLADPDAIAAEAEPVTLADDPDRALWGAVARLPEKQRAAIVLRFAVDLRYRDVGAAIGCSERAARRSVHEAIKSLRANEAIEPEVVS